MTADRKVLSEEYECRLQHRCAVVVQDPLFLLDPNLPNEKN